MDTINNQNANSGPPTTNPMTWTADELNRWAPTAEAFRERMIAWESAKAGRSYPPYRGMKRPHEVEAERRGGR